VKQIVIASANGGTGKTTLCANLAIALRGLGRDIVVVDLSPQNALRLHAGLDPATGDGLSRATLSERPWSEIQAEAETGYGVIPFGALNETDRRAFEALLDAQPEALARHLDRLDLNDETIVLIDTPAGASVYLEQALANADMVVTTLLADAASYASFPVFEGILHTYCRAEAFEQRRYVLNRVDRSRQLSSDVTQLFSTRLKDRLLGVLHDDQAVCEALASQLPVLRYEGHSQAAVDLKHLARALVEALSATETAT
jgi:cellulose synthase operon protein YhjQ